MNECKVRCGDCRFWEKLDEFNLANDDGICRRYPPSLPPTKEEKDISTESWFFPITLIDEWCGEFQPNESHPQGQSLDFLQLSLRARRAIRFTIPENRRFDSSGFRVISLEDLLSLTAKQLLERKNCGKKTIAEIREKLAAHGLHLKDDNVAATTPAS